MQKELIQQKVDEIIYDVLREKISFDDISPDKHLVEDLGAVSAEALEIFLTIMYEFDIELERKVLIHCANLDHLYNYIADLLLQANLGPMAQLKGGSA